MENTRTFQPGTPVVCDFETTGLSPYAGARAFAAVLTWPEDGYSEVYRGDLSRVKELWAIPSVPVIAHNLKFELSFAIYDFGIDVPVEKELHDTMIMHQLLDNLSPKHSLDYIALQYAGYVKEWEEADNAISQAARIYGTYDKIPWEEMNKYIRYDGERTALLFNVMYPKLKGAALSEYRMEIDLIRVTQRMEQLGIAIEPAKARELIKFMEKELEENQHRAGDIINLGSPQQIARLLYDKIGLPKLGRDDFGMPTRSVDKNVLDELSKKSNHSIIDCILKHRSYTTGISTINKYLTLAGESGIIHPSINTNSAKTGRETSNNPNLQNVAKEFNARSRYPVPARKCFRARPGYVLLSCDYAGIEMRFAVQATGSDRLRSLLSKDFDFHDASACSFYGDRYTKEKDAKKKKALRSSAKNARFAMLYGAGPDAVARTLGIGLEETEVGCARDKEQYPEFYALMDNCIAEARRRGYITTFFGRKLKVPHNAIYSATDYKIQGSAAGLFKRAQIRVDALLRQWGDARMLLPVHDELVQEYPRNRLKELDNYRTLVSEAMTQFNEVTVPMKVEWSMSTYTWADTKEI